MLNESINGQVSSTRPYLVRAFYEWIIDNDLTPYVMIDATVDKVYVPRQYVEDGKIVLNISPTATDELLLSNYHIQFEASFSGKIEQINVPIKAVLAIYARENGRGMFFGDEEHDDYFEEPPESQRGDDPNGGGDTKSKPTLRIVK
jgi:stringent starvation protein B